MIQSNFKAVLKIPISTAEFAAVAAGGASSDGSFGTQDSINEGRCEAIFGTIKKVTNFGVFWVVYRASNPLIFYLVGSLFWYR